MSSHSVSVVAKTSGAEPTVLSVTPCLSQLTVTNVWQDALTTLPAGSAVSLMTAVVMLRLSLRMSPGLAASALALRVTPVQTAQPASWATFGMMTSAVSAPTQKTVLGTRRQCHQTVLALSALALVPRTRSGKDQTVRNVTTVSTRRRAHLVVPTELVTPHVWSVPLTSTAMETQLQSLPLQNKTDASARVLTSGLVMTVRAVQASTMVHALRAV